MPIISQCTDNVIIPEPKIDVVERLRFKVPGFTLCNLVYYTG